MEKIYEQSKDLHVAAVIVHAKDGLAYEDAACTIGVPFATLADLFLKGSLCIVTGSSIYRPNILDHYEKSVFYGGGAELRGVETETEA